MRFVKRTRKPAVLSRAAVREFVDRHAGKKTARQKSMRRQTRSSFKSSEIEVFQELEAPLHRLFRGKCAYCERAFEESDRLQMVVGHFWPVSVFPERRFDWKNLYAVCADCNRIKGDRFVEDRSGVAALLKENRSDARSALIDPCVDNPGEHLLLKDTGEVVSITRSVERARDLPGGIDRGQETIDTLRLNRRGLIRARKDAIISMEVAATARGSFERYLRYKGQAALCEDKAPHAGLLRTNLAARIVGSGFVKQLSTRHILGLMAVELRVHEDLQSAQRQLKSKGSKATKKKVAKKKASRKAKSAPQSQLPIVGTSVIKRVVVSNYKAIERFESTIPFEASREVLDVGHRLEGPPPSGWLTFLGANGTGKSCLLEAIALALGGAGLAKSRLPAPASVIRKGKRKATIEVYLSTQDEPILLTVTAGKGFVWTGSNEDCFLRAYGATRLTANDRHLVDASANGLTEIGNLFDPFQPLRDPNRWLASLSEIDRDFAFRTIRDLIELPEKELIEFKNGAVSVGGYTLDVLSLGYKTIVSLACDIMAGLTAGSTDMQFAIGVVLLDELGTHLHPTWKMALVPRLRNAFRSVQFITTTHEPLCLRGHDVEEVVCVSREWTSKTRWASAFIKPGIAPRSLRVDQLLTSEHFGMMSTIDPQLERDFQEYYALLELPTPLKKMDRERAKELSRLLMRESVIGYTPRDQLIYETIDKHLVDERKERRKYWRARFTQPATASDGTNEDAEFLKQQEQRRDEVRNLVAQMWEMADTVEDKP